MSKIVNNNKITEYTTEYHSIPNSKPKRVRKRKPTRQEIEIYTENIEIQYNCVPLIGIAALWLAPSLSMAPTGVKIGLSILYFLSGFSTWINKE